MARRQETIRTALMVAKRGRSVHQAEIGKWCRARHVVQLVSTAPWVSAVRSKRGKSNVNAPTHIPIKPSTLIPAIRNRRGIRCQTEAAQSENALHMLME